ncbi:MAG: type IV pilin-like G/H family protein, partial [Waterburya sp.]
DAIDEINAAQGIYFSKISSFTKNQNDLVDIIPNDYTIYYDYQLDILENGKLAQVIANPKLDNLKSYIGGTLNFNNFFINRFFHSIVCASEQPTQDIPQSIKLVDGQLNCPTGFKIFLHRNVENETSRTFSITSRMQEFYFMKTRNFTKNQSDLGNYFFTTYYDYQLDLLENGKLALLVATPKFDNLRSYIGGIFYFNGSIESLGCISEQPTQDIPQSIKLVNSKFECPTGFRMEFSSKEEDVLNVIEVTNKAQQTYFLENSNFTNNEKDLETLPSNINDYYDYSLEVFDNGEDEKLAKVVAIPKIDNLRIYAGATVNNHGKLQSITCVSERPSNDLPLSIELVGGKLKCSAGFEELSN